MKLCVFIIFQLCPWIIRVGDWALRWTEGNAKVQVFFVMLFFPVVMNALQYYIIDNFIKDQKPPDHEPIPSEDGEGGDSDEEQHRRSLGSYDGEIDDEIAEDRLKDGTEIRADEEEDKDKSNLKPDSQHVDVQNPVNDGEGSSSGCEGGSPRSMPKDRTAGSEQQASKDA